MLMRILAVFFSFYQIKHEAGRRTHRQRERETYFGPADMTGHDSAVQNSAIVPYSMLIWLKKSTAVGGGRAYSCVFVRVCVRVYQSLLSEWACLSVCLHSERTVDGDPFVEILACWQFDGLAQVS